MFGAKLRKMEEDYFPSLPPGSLHLVRDVQQARLLSDDKSWMYFEPFLAREMSVSAAAKEVGCSLHTMLYRVRVFLKADLLRVTREEARAGRPIKHYRSLHDAYFIPLDLIPYAALEERLKAQVVPNIELLTQAWAHFLRGLGQYGRRLYRDAEGFTRSDSGGEERPFFDHANPKVSAAFDFFLELQLPQEEAKRLQLELLNLYQRYLPYREKSGNEAYLFQSALVPKAPS